MEIKIISYRFFKKLDTFHMYVLMYICIFVCIYVCMWQYSCCSSQQYSVNCSCYCFSCLLTFVSAKATNQWKCRYILDQWSSNFSVHENNLEDSLKQITESFPQTWWLNSSVVQLDKLLLLKLEMAWESWL